MIKTHKIIKELRQDLKELTSLVQKLAYKLERNSENNAHEREKLVLRLENALLKIERRFLLGGKDEED